MADDPKRCVVVDLRQHLISKRRPYVYPTDREHELRITGWTEEGLIREARENGYTITRAMIRSWVKRGLIPPPRR